MAGVVQRASSLVRSGTLLLDDAGVHDATLLARRAAGLQNLQAHAHHLSALAAAFLVKDRASHRILLGRTHLAKPLSADKKAWPLVQGRFKAFLATSATLLVSKTLKSGAPLTADDVASTYLPVSWGGTQTRGGGGISTLKRALKIGAHVLERFK